MNTLIKEIKELGKKQEFVLICILSAGLVFGIMLLTGTMNCGWHLTDDHEFLRWIYMWDKEGYSFWQVLSGVMKEDLQIRFRPIYMPARVLSCYIFRDNLICYYIMKALETYASAIVLYYLGRQMVWNKAICFMFSTVSIVGYQSVAWWKLGTHEMQSVLLLAVSLLTLIWGIQKSRKSWFIVSVISAIFMMLYKESFLALVPFMLCFAIYYDCKYKKKEIAWRNILDSIKELRKYLLAMSVIFVGLCVAFLLLIGGNGYDMASAGETSLVEGYYNGIVDSLKNDLKWYWRFGILFVAVLLTYWEQIKRRWAEIGLFVIFTVPEIAIYGRVGFSGHYVLPEAIGISLFFIIGVWSWKILSGKRRVIYVTGILLLLAANGRVALREADYFRYRGEGITTAFETIYDLTEEKNDLKVLSCFGSNAEANMTLQYWLLNKGIDNVYYWDEETETIQNNYEYAPVKRDDDEMCDMSDIDVIIMHNREDRHWGYDPSIDFSEFDIVQSGTLTLGVRKDAGLNVPGVNVEGLRINF